MFVLLILLVFIVIITTAYIRRIRNEIEKKHQLVVAHQKELIDNSIQIIERERERIASDLHDGVIGQLHRIKLMNSDKNLNTLLSESINTTRAISHDLTPPMIEESSIIDLMEDFINPLKGKYDISLFHNTSTSFVLDKQQKLHIFRTFQELLNNVIKHAQARQIDIIYRHTASLLCLILRDDGIGFKGEITNGLGMKNIELRMQALKASYRIKNRKPHGTKFIFVLKSLDKDQVHIEITK